MIGEEGTRLVLAEHGAFFDGLEPPELRTQGTGSLLDTLEPELCSTASARATAVGGTPRESAS